MMCRPLTLTQGARSARTRRWAAETAPSTLTSPTKLAGMPVLEFDPPDRFVAGTVGPPGQRTFFLQASAGSRLTSVSLEKGQVSTLAERVVDLLDDFAGDDASDADPEAVEDAVSYTHLTLPTILRV